jgi:hypothetical protein
MVLGNDEINNYWEADSKAIDRYFLRYAENQKWEQLCSK